MNMAGITDDEIKNLIKTINIMKSNKVTNIENLFDVALLVTSFSSHDLKGLHNFIDTLHFFRDFVKNNISRVEMEKINNLKKEVIKNGNYDQGRC